MLPERRLAPTLTPSTWHVWADRKSCGETSSLCRCLDWQSPPCRRGWECCSAMRFLSPMVGLLEQFGCTLFLGCLHLHSLLRLLRWLQWRLHPAANIVSLAAAFPWALTSPETNVDENRLGIRVRSEVTIEVSLVHCWVAGRIGCKLDMSQWSFAFVC